MNYDVLSRIDVGVYRGSEFAGTQILTFEEWVLLCKQLGMEIYIDRKYAWTSQEAAELVGIVRKHGMLDHATWATGNTALTDDIRANDPNARILLLNYPTQELIETFRPYNTGRGVVFAGDVKSLNAEAIQLGITNGFQVEGYFVDFWQLYSEADAFTAIRNAINAGCQRLSLDHYFVHEAFEWFN